METSPLLPGVVLQELHSAILNQDLQLYVKLPWSYESTKKAYPVLFCLDANRSFPLYATTSLIYETPPYGKSEIVIVGVGYQVDGDRLNGLAQWAAWRTRDLTPVNRPDTDNHLHELLSKIPRGKDLSALSGGAPQFLDCLRKEVIPAVETNFRVLSQDRGLAGYSYGGLFVLFTLFHTCEVFQRYFAGSPSMWDVLFEYEQAYADAHTDLQATLLMTAGSRETHLVESVQRMADRLKSHGYPGLNLHYHIIEGEGHISGGPAATSRALGMLYYGEIYNA